MARVGNSEAYYIGPETMAALPVAGNDQVTGGLPIKAGTESETITSSDLRDKQGALKRQAARFRIYQYDDTDFESYPNGGGEEICIGSTVNGKVVVDILWMVHIANKKANTYVLENPNLGAHDLVIDGYKDGNLPPLRNASEGPFPNSTTRVRKLTIDPGPRAIRGTAAEAVKFDKETTASYLNDNGEIIAIEAYPKLFPDDSFPQLNCPSGKIDTLGELRTDDFGRLLVVGAYGRACGWFREDGTPLALLADVDNDGWFDDTGDGPVTAVLVYEDNTVQEVHGAWVVSTDPAYAPQTLNVVSLWDDMYDTWVRKLDLVPEIYAGGAYNGDFEPAFDDHLLPIFRSVEMQQWNTNLPEMAINAHKAVGKITADDNPMRTILSGLAYVRNPNNPDEAEVGAPLMPLSLGDQGQAFLSPSRTPYFFLTQWNNNKFNPTAEETLGPGEFLDRAVLVNCLGGRFSPGIDMTFIIRQPDLYIQEWQTSGGGPFRIKAKALDYRDVQGERPFLSDGYVPLHTGPVGLEPGDTSKFMAIPWHTDYNSCATHETDPNPLNSTTLYWSWPAQRPVAVYAAKDVVDGKLGKQRYSLRGRGTESDNPANQGRYQDRLDIIRNWSKIGFIIQGSAIDGDVAYDKDQYLEVESLLDEHEVVPWPINASE